MSFPLYPETWIRRHEFLPLISWRSFLGEAIGWAFISAFPEALNLFIDTRILFFCLFLPCWACHLRHTDFFLLLLLFLYFIPFLFQSCDGKEERSHLSVWTLSLSEDFDGYGPFPHILVLLFQFVPWTRQVCCTHQRFVKFVPKHRELMGVLKSSQGVRLFLKSLCVSLNNRFKIKKQEIRKFYWIG